MKINDKKLVERYTVKKESTQTIAEAFNISAESVRRRLIELGVPRRNNGEGALDDLTGCSFGGYTVLARVASKQAGMTRWQCRCRCGTVKEVNSNALKSGRAASCGGCRFHNKYPHVGDLSGGEWGSVDRSANFRKIPFIVTQEQAWKLFQSQEGNCALSGVPLRLVKNWSTRTRGQTASLDRIDSSLGYVDGNLQWVHKDVNYMKRTLDQLTFIQWCKKIAANN